MSSNLKFPISTLKKEKKKVFYLVGYFSHVTLEVFISPKNQTWKLSQISTNGLQKKIVEKLLKKINFIKGSCIKTEISFKDCHKKCMGEKILLRVQISSKE